MARRAYTPISREELKGSGKIYFVPLGDFSIATAEDLAKYYETKYGIAVAASESFGAASSYDIGKMDAGVAQAAFSRIDRPDIDALVVPGGNFPTMDWIAPWERQFGKPVITTNQATLWAVLRAMSINTPLAGKGRLLEQMPQG